ncbi:type II toxin-antitoxin system RelE/ParE family toxin [Pseudomonas lundensis]|nr:type II toxin-antitoxin system RelE/ParE family toxin [Pseudomonas lundensis]
MDAETKGRMNILRVGALDPVERQGKESSLHLNYQGVHSTFFRCTMYLNMERVPVSHALVFIETPMFTRQIKQIATDDELKELQKELQKELIESPDKGDLIQKTGGLRKIRMATGSQGKSGSTRVIYFLATEEVIYLVMAYQKSVKDSLTDTEKVELKRLTKLLKGEV